MNRTTAVGMYPAGAAYCGTFDVSGNVWEWTLTEHKSGKSDDMTSIAPRVVRGGSWRDSQSRARLAYRYGISPVDRLDYVGFRLVGVVPSR